MLSAPLCHSERSEESMLSKSASHGFFAALRMTKGGKTAAPAVSLLLHSCHRPGRP
jgi:hypothetical protein